MDTCVCVCVCTNGDNSIEPSSDYGTASVFTRSFNHYLVAESGTCTVGSNNYRIASEEVYDESLLLFMDDPATCSGRAIAWHYCFQSSHSIYTSRAVFVLYRQVHSQLVLVEGSTRTINVHPSDEDLEGLHCKTVALDSVPVLEGDVVGVCLPVYEGTLKPLHISAVAQNPQDIYRIEVEHCSFDIPEHFSDSSPELVESSTAINLYLEIGTQP